MRYNYIRWRYYIKPGLGELLQIIAGLCDRAKCTNSLVSRWLAFCWKTINAHTVTEIHQPENWFAAPVVKTQWWRWYMIALNKLSCHGPFPMFIFKLPMVFDVVCGWSSAEEKFIFFREPCFERDLCIALSILCFYKISYRDRGDSLCIFRQVFNNYLICNLINYKFCRVEYMAFIMHETSL